MRSRFTANVRTGMTGSDGSCSRMPARTCQGCQYAIPIQSKIKMEMRNRMVVDDKHVATTLGGTAKRLGRAIGIGLGAIVT
jgi:hypothetical protein